MRTSFPEYMEPSGQPSLRQHDVHKLDGRIVLDIRYAEKHGLRSGQAAACPGRPTAYGREPCGRIAFRNVGDAPQVKCVCGEEFNANYHGCGSTPWPEPLNGQPFVVMPAER